MSTFYSIIFPSFSWPWFKKMKNVQEKFYCLDKNAAAYLHQTVIRRTINLFYLSMAVTESTLNKTFLLTFACYHCSHRCCSVSQACVTALICHSWSCFEAWPGQKSDRLSLRCTCESSFLLLFLFSLLSSSSSQLSSSLFSSPHFQFSLFYWFSLSAAYCFETRCAFKAFFSFNFNLGRIVHGDRKNCFLRNDSDNFNRYDLFA